MMTCENGVSQVIKITGAMLALVVLTVGLVYTVSCQSFLIWKESQ